ncbi:hypothetical protein FUA23_18970 [Neolewinella aurantiaca]|uniref:Uncharacterized protein n=1 Tax=Neolewinella aurantiaca TaxID=2602767 RepID=A0A5C7FID7_9BACT|nr:hypothetical protein [Neolewinella aurantiaca]TXF87077.1 hypothetical protein FUA23_18970 [Neolewinella aurantiaca]
MNKLFFFLAFFMITATSLVAQPGRNTSLPGERTERAGTEMRSERFGRIKAARQAFITEELALTAQQAADFFPVYWEYEERLAEGKKDGPARKTPGHATQEYTEEEARTELLNRRTHKQQMLTLTLEAEDKYLKILPATKVIRLPEVEREFRKKLWERTRRPR